ncbi:NDP-hexose 2,3-dehydratase family protein [Kordiimonas aestuarii]|uniref:NDP-hexose 2,3-dehydratase family protein n=1 Tax=Kordiimonas aestuarii TaxID=1005925 RepID=UPI0021D0C656|nr:NDP-hexose 2,3-dehydratase family protein [Kordiimonas aestuarii]
MLEWLAERRVNCAMRFEAITFAQSKEWQMGNGQLSHMTGGFFSVHGVIAGSNVRDLDGLVQPIINQPEIGILGFMVAKGDDGYQWLVQAKAEPGNIASVQLAPSVQATHSNYMRRHGGAATAYLAYFTGTSDALVSDSLQSEQGTRFLKKFNRNAMCLLEEKAEIVNEHYHWLSAEAIRQALGTEFAINTDARSVIVSSPWKYVAGEGVPFSGAGPYQQALYASYQAPGERDIVPIALERVAALRQHIALSVEAVALEALPGWAVLDDRVHAAGQGGPSIEVRQYHVHAPEREKIDWDQPLVLSTSSDEVVLLCQKRNGHLQFLLRPAIEVGLTGGVEFGPSFKKETAASQPDWLSALVDGNSAETLISIDQSDEGGRFMQACCRYQVALVPEGHVADDDGHNLWVTLGELEHLCAAPGVLTNEARSVVSLLLHFA